MQIEVIGAYGGESDKCRMTCLVINGSIALDAGSLSQGLSIERQRRISTILLTHSHVDHTNSLPFFIENVYDSGRSGVDIYASPATIYALRKNLFNNAAWPDFTRLPHNLSPSVRFRELADEQPVVVDGVRFTPVPVDHVIPTYGFLIEEDGVAVLWSSDTGPTKRLWEIANLHPRLRALFIETSFDDTLQPIADVSGHLTPRTLSAELRKLDYSPPVLIHHMKPPCVGAIRRDVDALGNPRVGFLEQGKVYKF